MKTKLLALIVIFIAAVSFSSCSEEEINPDLNTTKQTNSMGVEEEDPGQWD